MKTYKSIKTLFFCFIAQIHQYEVHILRSSCLCSSFNGSTNHQKSMFHPSIPLYSTRKKRITKKLTNKTAMLHRRQRSPKMRLYSTSMHFPCRRHHHLHLPRLSLFLLFLRSRKRKRRSSNRKLNPSSYLFRFFFFFFFSSNKKTMLHQQSRSTDLREKSYVYDSRGWDGGLCLIEWMDAWMDGWVELGYFKGELERKKEKKR